MGVSDTDSELSLLTILPMIQRVVLCCLNRDNFPYSKSQFIIFTVLLQKGSLTMKEVASFISSSKEQATRAVAPLVNDGYVERFTSPENRSYIHVRLTDAGRKYITTQEDQLYHNLSQLLENSVPDSEKQELFEALRKAITILEKVK